MLAHVWPLLLLLLTRDGVLHRLDGASAHESTEPAPRATAVALFGAPAHVALLTGERLTIDGRALPGRFGDVRALAGGTQLWALTAVGADAVDARSGRRSPGVRVAGAHRIAADGDAVLVEAAGVVHEGERRFTLPGPAIALAAGAGKLWAVTADGKLWQLDRGAPAGSPAAAPRELGLGRWSGTLGMAWGGGALWVATVAGKLWRIDVDASGRAQKTIVAMDGWQGTIDLSVSR